MAAIADGQATLAVADQRRPVRAAPVADPAMIGAVSRTYLKKYATSPYAEAMVRADILPATLRFDPL